MPNNILNSYKQSIRDRLNQEKEHIQRERDEHLKQICAYIGQPYSPNIIEDQIKKQYTDKLYHQLNSIFITIRNFIKKHGHLKTKSSIHNEIHSYRINKDYYLTVYQSTIFKKPQITLHKTALYIFPIQKYDITKLIICAEIGLALTSEQESALTLVLDTTIPKT